MKQFLSKNPTRLAVLTAFFVNGAIFATWVSRIPAIQAKLHLSEGALGIILLGISAGVLVALSLAGGLIARFGSPRVIITGTAIMCVLLPILALIPHPVLLWVTLFVFGGGMSAMDVAMNEQAVWVEREAKRPLMSSFHAAYSIGGLAGALIGAGMASIPAISPFIHFLLGALAFGAAMLVAYPHLVPANVVPEENASVFRLPERALWLLGFIAFCSAIGEGAMADWSAVYLTQVLETTAAYAALGYAAFSLTMTAGRLLGDAITTAWKPETIVRAGGVLATAGLLAAVLTRTPVVVLIGFAAIGIGLANIIPLAFSAAGKFPGIPAGTAIAGVATIGYAGFLAGPPVIGLVAEQTNLRIALTFVLILIATLIFTARAIDGKGAEG